MFDLSTLSPEADAIVLRHEMQDHERQQANRSRIVRLQELRADRQRATSARDSLRAAKIVGGDNIKNNSAPDRDAKTETERLIRAEEIKIARLDPQIAALEASAPDACLTAVRIKSELDRLSSLTLDNVERPTMTLTDGERDAADALPRFRENVIQAKAAKRAALHQPLPAATVKEAARRQIHRLAARGVPMVRSLFAGGDIGWPKVAAPTTVGANYVQEIDAAALLAFLFEEQLVAKVEEIINITAGMHDAPMPMRERTAHFARLDAEIDYAERVEAAAVEQIIAEGGTASHRPDISVLAVLSLRAT